MVRRYGMKLLASGQQRAKRGLDNKVSLKFCQQAVIELQDNEYTDLFM